MISEVTPARTDLVGNGTVGPYTGLFQIDSKTEVKVLQDSVVLTVDTDYTVGGIGGSSFTVTLGTAIAATVNLSLIRKQPIEQQSDYTVNSGISPARVEADLDDSVKVTQMLAERIGRAIKWAEGSLKRDVNLAEPTDGYFLYYDLATNTFKFGVPTNSTLADPVTVGHGGTGAITASAARTALAVAGLADVNAFTKTQRWAKGADLASAAALTPGTDGNYFHVTGTVTITSIASATAGTLITLRFAGALTFTHNATSLILPSAANITTAANDTALMVSEGSGNWRCLSYVKASGAAVATATTVSVNDFTGFLVTNDAGDLTNDINIGVGACSSDDAVISDRVLISLTTALIKRLDATWVVATNQGGRIGASAGVAIANTTYHVFVILRPDTGVVDVAMDVSVTGANIASQCGAAYTKKRRIRSIMRESAAIVLEDQTLMNPDWIPRRAPILIFTETPASTNRITKTALVPIGIAGLRARMNHSLVDGTNVNGVRVKPLSETDAATSSTAAPGVDIFLTNNGRDGGIVDVTVDASAQYGYRAIAASGTYTMVQLGYFDTKGK